MIKEYADSILTTTAQKIKQQTAKDILTFFPPDVCTDGEYTDAEMVACLSGVLKEVRRKIEEISG